MNFFEQQDQARKKTGQLVTLFVIAVILIIALTTLVVASSLWGLSIWGKIGASTSIADYLDWVLLFKTALVVITLVGGAVLYKRIQLGKGGYTIAERLGGVPIYSDTQDPDERQLLNVVEEMAIAAGMPVPPIFVLDETTINAFAAGYSDSDAVLGITRGAMQRLTRDQLQGIIAHEFSHILHGDMRLNLNLITALSGIIFIGQSGRSLVCVMGRSRSYRRNNLGGSAAFALGAGASLVLIGAIGTFFGNLIKSAVSRQREFLADASAVQYTRNPEGIAGALKVIGSGVGTGVRAHRAKEFSHMFFGDVLSVRSFNFFATHPPLEQRISRIDRYWDGKYLPGKPLPSKTVLDDTAKANASIIDNLADSLKVIGMLDPVMIAIAGAMIESLPTSLYDAARNPASAYALMLAMRLDSNPAIQSQQLTYLADAPAMAKEVVRLKALVDALHPAEILPLIEIAIPALKQQSAQQYEQLKWLLMQFIMADKVSDHKEWLHYRLLCHFLDSQFIKPGKNKKYRRNYHGLYQVDNACLTVLSLLANVSHDNNADRDLAFDSGLSPLKIKVNQRITPDDLNLNAVNAALEQLEYLVPLLKQEFLAACAQCIGYDNEVTVLGWDLLRVISVCLSCPMPPVQRPTATETKTE
ncbi:MAG: M48 family metallopeptidase [Gammaproteobacteria bacterium]|nr:M48 family metallopeptidase [Gammaproteobacteria bacterium]